MSICRGDKQQTERAAQVEQISGQIQALNDTMDELKVRLAKLSKQFDDMQAAQQSMAAQQTQTQQQTQAMAAISSAWHQPSRASGSLPLRAAADPALREAQIENELKALASPLRMARS